MVHNARCEDETDAPSPQARTGSLLAPSDNLMSPNLRTYQANVLLRRESGTVASPNANIDHVFKY